MSPQSYPIVSYFKAKDYNQLANDINEVVALGSGDAGYGQDQLFVNLITSGTRISRRHWLRLFDAMKFAAIHQGTLLTTPTTLLNGDFRTKAEVVAHMARIMDDIEEIRANKLNYTLSKMSIQSNLVSSMNEFVVCEPDPTDEQWGQENQWYEFRVNFVDEDSMRHFFNAGGEIRIESELDPNLPDIPEGYHFDTSEGWHRLLFDIGVVKIQHSETASSKGAGTPGLGYTGLIGSYQNVYTKRANYIGLPNNAYEVWAKLHSDHQIDVAVYFLNNEHLNTYGGYCGYTGYSGYSGYGGYGGYSNYITGQIQGVLSMNVSQQRADDPHPSRLGVISPSPTYQILHDMEGTLYNPNSPNN